MDELVKDIHPENAFDILVKLFVFNLEISGTDIKEEQSEKIKVIYFTLPVFHLDISGRDVKDEQPENI